MDQPSLFQRFFQCCRKPFISSKPQIKKISEKLSLRSKSKVPKRSISHKVSLKQISTKKNIVCNSKPQIKAQTKSKPAYMNRCSSSHPAPLKIFRQQIVKQNKSSLQLKISPRGQMRPLSYQPTSYEPLMIPVSPTSMERRTYDFEEDKKNGSSLAPQIVSYRSQREAVQQNNRGCHKKGFFGEKTRERTVQESIRGDNEYENLGRVGKKLERTAQLQKLGESNKTLLSMDEKDEKSLIKVEQSIIMIDYFNPNSSQIKNWGVTSSK